MFSIIYGIIVVFISISVADLFDPNLKIFIIILFYYGGYAFARYRGWTTRAKEEEKELNGR